MAALASAWPILERMSVRSVRCQRHLGLRLKAPGLPPVIGRYPDDSRLALGVRCVSSSDSGSGDNAGSGQTNSYINLGVFNTMATDDARMAVGIAYMMDALRLQRDEYNGEAAPPRRASKGLTLSTTLLQVAKQHHSTGDSEEALRLYEESLEVLKESRTFYEGVMQDKDGKPVTKVIRVLQQAIFQQTEIYVGLGMACHEVGRSEESINWLKDAMDARKELLGGQHPSVSECLNNLAAVYFNREAYQKSVEYYEQALELLIAANDGVKEGEYLALTYYNIGTCRLRLGQQSLAVQSLDLARKLAEQAYEAGHPMIDLIKQTQEQAFAARSE
mmetsp:Transcript_57528/g.136852  ORF Transcript_57528/g.136852 Transcript_57528/m.136852 type:complete len:332 (+) Transcript_57528:99-1094(+)